MRRENVLARPDAPDVQIVDGRDAVEGLESVHELDDVDVRRRALHEVPENVDDELLRDEDDADREKECGHWVHPQEPLVTARQPAQSMPVKTRCLQDLLRQHQKITAAQAP